MLTMALVLLGSPAFAGDKDKDGVDNKTDECKLEPEDKDGFEDEDGCPDPDNDKDGMLDGDDKCADEAEDKDGFEDDDGCPDPDNDGDGVLDGDDQCPAEMEGDDGTPDGCPAVSYELMNSEGWAPAIKELNDTLSAALEKGLEGCPDAVAGGQGWMAKNDAKGLHEVYTARLARAPESFNGALVIDVVDAQASFWGSAKGAFDIYCKDDAKWTELSAKLDGVYARAKNPEE